MTADGIELIDEYEAGCLRLGLLEQVAHPRANADKHLNELTAAQRKERDLRFARDGPGQQSFAGSRRTEQQYPFGNLGTERLVSLRVAEKINDLHQLGLRLVAAGNIIEIHARRFLGDEPARLLPKPSTLSPADPIRRAEGTTKATKAAIGSNHAQRKCVSTPGRTPLN